MGPSSCSSPYTMFPELLEPLELIQLLRIKLTRMGATKKFALDSMRHDELLKLARRFLLPKSQRASSYEVRNPKTEKSNGSTVSTRRNNNKIEGDLGPERKKIRKHSPIRFP